MVREKDVRDAEIWPWRETLGVALSAKRSRSLRKDVDWRRAELKSAFCCTLVSKVQVYSRNVEDKPWSELGCHCAAQSLYVESFDR